MCHLSYRPTHHRPRIHLHHLLLQSHHHRLVLDLLRDPHHHIHHHQFLRQPYHNPLHQGLYHPRHLRDLRPLLLLGHHQHTHLQRNLKDPDYLRPLLKLQDHLRHYHDQKPPVLHLLHQGPCPPGQFHLTSHLRLALLPRHLQAEDLRQNTYLLEDHRKSGRHLSLPQPNPSFPFLLPLLVHSHLKGDRPLGLPDRWVLQDLLREWAIPLSLQLALQSWYLDPTDPVRMAVSRPAKFKGRTSASSRTTTHPTTWAGWWSVT